MNVAVIIFVGGVVLFAFLYFWSRQHPEEAEAAGDVERMLQDIPDADGANAILVSREYGQLIYANGSARRWLGMNGGDPNLEQVASLIQPVDHFLQLFADESQTSFQLGQRWVEASSHRIPAAGEVRTVVIMRPLTAAATPGTTSTDSQRRSVLDFSLALSIIHQIGDNVDVTVGVSSVLQALLGILRSALDFDAGQINLRDPQDSRRFEPLGWVGDYAYLVELSELGGDYRIDEGVTGWIVRHQAAILLRNADEVRAAQPKVTSIIYGSVIGAPLIFDDEVIGTLELAANAEGVFGPADQALLQAVAKPMVTVIRNAQLYAQQVRRVEEFTTLQQVVQETSTDETGLSSDAAEGTRIYAALNQRIAQLAEVDMSGVFLYNDQRLGLVPALPFHGLPDALMYPIFIALPEDSPQHDIWANQPYWVSNSAADEALISALGLEGLVNVAGIRNTAWFPMQVSGQRFGMLVVANRRGGGFTPMDIQNLQVLATQAAIVVENLRLAERERRLDAELAGLQKMANAVGALDRESEFYSQITQQIAELMDIEICGILLYSTDADTPQLISQLPFYGVADDEISGYSIPLPPGTVFEELWDSEQFWFSNRVQADALVYEAKLDELAGRIGITRTLFAVMASGGRRLGAVQIANKRSGGAFDEGDGRLLAIFATQAATLIENARLFREVQRSSEQAEQLRRIAEMAGSIVTSEDGLQELLGEISALMNSPIIFVNVFDQMGNLVAYPNWVYGVQLNEPVVYDVYSRSFEYSVAASWKPFLSNDLAHTKLIDSYRDAADRYGLVSSLVVPLVVGERSLGEMGVSNRQGSYTDADIQLLSGIAAQITSALERLMLYERTGQNLNRRMQELDAISEVSNALTNTLDFEQIFNIIRKQALVTTGASGSTVALLRPVRQWAQPDAPEMDRRLGNAAVMTWLADVERESVWRGSDTVLVVNYEAQDLAASPPEARSAVTAGIVYAGQPIGVLHIYHTEPNRFDDRDASFLATLASKASLGYGNWVRFTEQQERSETLQRRVKQLSGIFELGQMLHSNIDPTDMLEAVAYRIQSSVGYDTVLMLLLDEDAGHMRRVTQAGMPLPMFHASQHHTISMDALGRLLRENYRISESFFFPVEQLEDWYAEEVRALSADFEGNRTVDFNARDGWRDGDMLLVPLTGANGELLGLISLDRPYTDQRPSDTSIQVLEIFAHQVASTLENNRLYMASLRNAEQEQLINEVIEAVSSSLEIGQMIQTLAREMQRVVRFDRVILALQDPQQSGFNVLRVDRPSPTDAAPAFIQERRVTLEHTVLGRTISEGLDRIYYAGLPDAERYDDLRSWQKAGEQIGIALPLISGAETFGAVYLSSDDYETSNFEDAQLTIRRTAQLFAGAVQNARLFQEAVELRVLNESVIESIQQGIIVLDRSGRIIALNSVLKRYGWDTQAALGRDIFEYRPAIAEVIGTELRDLLNTGVSYERINQELMDPNTGRGMIARNFYLYPLREEGDGRREGAVRGAVILVEDVTERAQMEKQMEARANQLAALTEVSSRITASLERYEVVSLALSEMKWLMPYDTMSLWRRNGSYMVLEGSSGVDKVDSEDEVRLRISDFSDVRLIVDTKRVVAHNYDTPLGPQAIPSGESARSWLGVPLVSQSHVVGMITLNHSDKHSYDNKDDQNIAFAFASQVAIALSNADLFEQTFDRTNELGTVLEAAQVTALAQNLDEVFRIVVELMLAQLEMDQCTIFSRMQVGYALTVEIDVSRSEDERLLLPVGSVYELSEYEAWQHVTENREAVVLQHIDEELRFMDASQRLKNQGHAAHMMVPLVVRDQAIGMILLKQYVADGRQMTQQKIRLANALGSTVAIAIQNARLSSDMEALVSESLFINDLTQALSRTLNTEDMVEIVRTQLPRVTSAEYVYLALRDGAAEQEAVTFPVAARDGAPISLPPRALGDDEVSFIITKNRFLTLGADYFQPAELRRSMGISAGEGVDYLSYMGVPVASAERVFGALVIMDSKRKAAFTMTDRRVMETIGSQLGSALQNADYVRQISSFAEDLEREVELRTEELEQERDRIDTLYQITSELARTLDMDRLQQRALGMVVKAVHGDDGVILALDPIMDQLYAQAALNPNTLFTRADGQQSHAAATLGMWLLENDSDVLVDDLHTFPGWDHTQPFAADWRSAMAVVLESNQNDPQGVMVVLSTRPQAFTEQEQRLLVAAANQVAAATNNADLYSLIRDQAERLGVMLRTEQEEAEKNSAILESIADGVILTDAEGQIVQFNTAAERILELPREQAIGQSMTRFTGLYGGEATTWAQAIQAQSDSPDDVEVFFDERLTLGDKVVNVQLSPVYTGGNFIGMVSVFRDITRDVEVDRLKSEFISNVSHELRTPLTPIKGFAEMLLLGAGGPISDQQRMSLGMIKDNVDRLTVLVDDVLDISRIDSGRDRLEVEPVSLAEVLRKVVVGQQQRHTGKKPNTALTLEIADDLPHVEADVSKLNRILSNLVDNAFNYTPDGGSIRIAAQVQPSSERVEVTVADTGVGIPDDFKEDIWLRFQRYEPHVLDLDVAGTGLGLSIVKEMVDQHHGDIWFESRLNEGTVFHLVLPVEQPAYIVKRATQSMQQVNGDANNPTED